MLTGLPGNSSHRASCSRKASSKRVKAGSARIQSWNWTPLPGPPQKSG